ncbi:MAG: phosphate acyltransferase PlsX [Bacteroidetes bacterium]|nr:phosphate acyltransferase PlsX [Bacteroidota bacterium]
MKIGLDVMGGDYAPDATIKGAILAQKEIPKSDRIVLIGVEDIIVAKLKEFKASLDDFDIVHAPDIIGMGEKPIKAFTQKPNSSISIGFKLLKSKKIDAFSSAGNTGAALVGAMYSVNTIPGVIRPCVSGFFPKENGGLSLILDIGANPDSKPDVLYQFAILGNIYAKYIMGIKNPRVGLLNIGEEEEKGNLQCQATFQLMKDTKDFNFVGNVESRDLFKDDVDVFVCDGFIGNIIVKQTEALYSLLVKHNLLDDYFKRFNYENFGGSPILGVNSSVLIGHGISNDFAIKNMLLLSREVHTTKLPQKIKAAMAKYAQPN